jgi:DNA-binding response OmpR family regulator
MGGDASLPLSSPGSRKRILHVEDDPATRETVLGVLSADHEVVSAFGLTDGLRLARNRQFALYLLGGMFKDGSCLELCYEIRALDPCVPVLFHSLLPKDLKPCLLLAGATEIIDKTSPAEALAGAIRRHIDATSLPQRRRTASLAG